MVWCDLILDSLIISRQIKLSSGVNYMRKIHESERESRSVGVCGNSSWASKAPWKTRKSTEFLWWNLPHTQTSPNFHLSLFLCVRLCLCRFYSFALVASTGRKKRHTGSRVLKYNLNISHWNAGANKRCVVNIRGRKTYYFYLSLPSYHKLSATESEFSSLHRLERNVETRTRWIYSLYTWFPHHHPT